MGRFGSKESIAVGGDVLFVSFSVDGKVVFFIESLQLATGLLHGAEFGSVPGGGGGERNSDGFPGGQGVEGVREDGVKYDGIVVR